MECSAYEINPIIDDAQPLFRVRNVENEKIRNQEEKKGRRPSPQSSSLKEPDGLKVETNHREKKGKMGELERWMGMRFEMVGE